MADPAPFVHPVNVRYLEVDQQGVVFNMWYLAYFDDAMTAYLAARGLPYQELLDAGFDVQLVHVEVDWAGGVGFGDDVGVAVTTARLGTTSFALAFAVQTGSAAEPVVTAEIVYVCVATDGTGKRPLPDALRTALAQEQRL
jgi:acyl-CoA thioester hydrolase